VQLRVQLCLCFFFQLQTYTHNQVSLTGGSKLLDKKRTKRHRVVIFKMSIMSSDFTQTNNQLLFDVSPSVQGNGTKESATTLISWPSTTFIWLSVFGLLTLLLFGYIAVSYNRYLHHRMNMDRQYNLPERMNYAIRQSQKLPYGHITRNEQKQAYQVYNINPTTPRKQRHVAKESPPSSETDDLTEEGDTQSESEFSESDYEFDWKK
jgi:hypothetical protein